MKQESPRSSVSFKNEIIEGPRLKTLTPGFVSRTEPIEESESLICEPTLRSFVPITPPIL